MRASAIRNTARVHCSSGWSLQAISDGSQAAVSTSTLSEKRHYGDRHHEPDFSQERAQVDDPRLRKIEPPFGRRKNIPARDVKRAIERPERLEPGRREAIGAHPIHQDVRSVRRAN